MVVLGDEVGPRYGYHLVKSCLIMMSAYENDLRVMSSSEIVLTYDVSR